MGHAGDRWWRVKEGNCGEVVGDFGRKWLFLCFEDGN